MGTRKYTDEDVAARYVLLDQMLAVGELTRDDHKRAVTYTQRQLRNGLLPNAPKPSARWQRNDQAKRDARAVAKGKQLPAVPGATATLDDRLTLLDDLRATGKLVDRDYEAEVARARAAAAAGRPMPVTMPQSSKKDIRAQAELAAARRARDSNLAHRRAAFDLALAEGRMTEMQHTEAVSRLDLLATEPVVVQKPVKQRSTFWSVFDSIDRFS